MAKMLTSRLLRANVRVLVQTHLDRELTILTMVFSTQNSVQIRKHDANQAEAICRLLEIVQFWDLTQPYKEIWCSNFSTAWVLADHVRVRA